MNSAVLDDFKVHVKLKLSALWAALMSCYIHGDYFSWVSSKSRSACSLSGTRGIGPDNRWRNVVKA